MVKEYINLKKTAIDFDSIGISSNGIINIEKSSESDKHGHGSSEQSQTSVSFAEKLRKLKE